MFSSVSLCKIKNPDTESTMPAPSMALRNCISALEVYCTSLLQVQSKSAGRKSVSLSSNSTIYPGVQVRSLKDSLDSSYIFCLPNLIVTVSLMKSLSSALLGLRVSLENSTVGIPESPALVQNPLFLPCVYFYLRTVYLQRG